MSIKKFFSALMIASFVNMSILPAFAIQETNVQNDTKMLKKQEKIFTNCEKSIDIHKMWSYNDVS